MDGGVAHGVKGGQVAQRLDPVVTQQGLGAPTLAQKPGVEAARVERLNFFGS